MKYKVRIPVMSYVTVTVELDSEERDDLIEAAVSSFEVYSKTLYSTDVVTTNNSDVTMDCEGMWDDEDLIHIEQIEE